MNWIEIDFNKTFSELSPTFFRGENFESFSKSFGSPLQTLADSTLYFMQHDSRVIYLEKVLNELLEVPGYDSMNHLATRKVFISDAPAKERDYLFLNDEPEVMWLYAEGEVIVEDDQEYLDVTPNIYYHFIINIESTITFDEATLRPKIDEYKLAGKQYIITTYEEY
jgi:hypothetical protein